MPGFVTINGAPEWRQASFLPGVYQGVNVNYSKNMNLDDVILNIRSQFSPMERQRHQLDLVEDICESISLLHHGKVVLQGDVATPLFGKAARLSVLGRADAGRRQQRMGQRLFLAREAGLGARSRDAVQRQSAPD